MVPPRLISGSVVMVLPKAGDKNVKTAPESMRGDNGKAPRRPNVFCGYPCLRDFFFVTSSDFSETELFASRAARN